MKDSRYIIAVALVRTENSVCEGGEGLVCGNAWTEGYKHTG